MEREHKPEGTRWIFQMSNLRGLVHGFSKTNSGENVLLQHPQDPHDYLGRPDVVSAHFRISLQHFGKCIRIPELISAHARTSLEV